MIKQLTITIALLTFALAFAPVVPIAYAAGGLPDEIVVGRDYTLQAGSTLSGNLVVYGGKATLEEGSRVTGDVVIVGGSVEARGEIGGDVTIVGGSADLKDTAIVNGDLVTVGGSLNRAPGAQIKGSEVTAASPSALADRSLFRPPFFGLGDLADLGIGTLFRILGWSLTLGVLALLVTLFWPDQTARVGQAILAAPFAAGGMGLLTAIVGGVLFTILILALCLGLIGWLGLTAAALFGWIAMGALVGARLAPALRLSETHPAVTGALGTFVFTLVVETLRLIPCLGLILAILLASVGLGAVVLTRFGTRAYLPSTPAPPPALVESA
ncbi:MAG: polymer-forming cytoskeletal protein [Chloroflexi bacterium]|nr:polymer-forming cytoskeletal protein [Chloroflexota bacterium]